VTAGAHRPPPALCAYTQAPARAASGRRCSASWPAATGCWPGPLRCGGQPAMARRAGADPCRRGRLARARFGGGGRGGPPGRAFLRWRRRCARRARPLRPVPVPGADRAGAARPAACRGPGPAGRARDRRGVPAHQCRGGARGAGQRGRAIHRLLDGRGHLGGHAPAQAGRGRPGDVRRAQPVVRVFAETTPLSAYSSLDLPTLYLVGGQSPASARAVARLLTSALPDVITAKLAEAPHGARHAPRPGQCGHRGTYRPHQVTSWAPAGAHPDRDQDLAVVRCAPVP
jgi:hypothetical protein